MGGRKMAFGQDTQYWLDWYAKAAPTWGPDSSYVQRVMASAGVAIPTQVKQEATVSYQTQLVESATTSAAEAGVTVEEWASAYVTAGGIVPPRAKVIIQTPEYQEWVATQAQAELEATYTAQAEASAAIRAGQEAMAQAAIAASTALNVQRDAGVTFTPDEGGALFDATFSQTLDIILEQQATGIIATQGEQVTIAQAIMAGEIAAILDQQKITSQAVITGTTGFTTLQETAAAGIKGGQITSGNVVTGTIQATSDDYAFITSLYRDLLGRDPDEEGLEYWAYWYIGSGRNKNLTKKEFTNAAIGAGEITGKIIPNGGIPAMIAGFDLGSNWPILGIIGAGALMMFKKEPGSKHKGKGGRRRK